MGFSKLKRKIREDISKWECLGYMGYGQGRIAAEHDDRWLRGKSACHDICKNVDACRTRHHARMDARYPQMAYVIGQAVRSSVARGLETVPEIVLASERARDLGIDEAVEVQNIVSQFGVRSMTDHYRAGEFENIQNGLDKCSPNNRRPIPLAKLNGDKEGS